MVENTIIREMYYDQVNDIYLVSKMGQIIKVQRPVSSASITGLYVISEAAFTVALLGVLLYNVFSASTKPGK
jgi:hypothetical protein